MAKYSSKRGRRHEETAEAIGRCCGELRDGSRCPHRGRVTYSGRAYCGHHDPERPARTRTWIENMKLASCEADRLAHEIAGMLRHGVAPEAWRDRLQRYGEAMRSAGRVPYNPEGAHR